MKYTHNIHTRGASLIEAVVASAVFAVAITAFLGVLQLGTRLSYDTKAYIGATALAQERMEYLRSLVYDDVGVTQGGSYSGSVSSGYEALSEYTENITLNGVSYTRRTLVTYYDDPADGVGGSDSNGNTRDYKTVLVEVSWESPNGTRSVSQVSNITPIAVES